MWREPLVRPSGLRGRPTGCGRSPAACYTARVRVLLATVQSHRGCTLKDVAGGFGTVFEVGASLPARLLERAKTAIADLPPVVLGTLAAQLGRAGHEVVSGRIRRGAAGHDPLPRADVLVLLTSLPDASAEVEVLAEARARGARAIAIGAAASARPLAFLEGADAVVRGEAEALGAGLLDPGLRGVVEAGDVEDLDRLPWPDWSAFPVRRFRYAMLTRRGPTLPIQSARGCPYGCGYCPWRVTARFRERDPEAVAREASYLRARHGVRALAFRDPIFNVRPERARAIAAGLRPLDLRWSAEMRADRLDGGLVDALADAGLRSLEIGVESADVEMLEAERRMPPDLGHIEDVVRHAERRGVRVICNYVLGLPGDTAEKIEATLALAERLGSFAVQFTTATPYPGTTLEERAGARMRSTKLDELTGFRSTWAHPTLSPEELGALRERAYVRYHFRPAYAWRFARQAARALLD